MYDVQLLCPSKYTQCAPIAEVAASQAEKKREGIEKQAYLVLSKILTIFQSFLKIIVSLM